MRNEAHIAHNTIQKFTQCSDIVRNIAHTLMHC